MLFYKWRNSPQEKLASYLGPSDFLHLSSLSLSTMHKYAPVSNMARICGERPPSMDAILKRAIRLIGDSNLTHFIDSLAHRRSVSALSQFYRYYHGMCSDELKSVIPPKTCLVCSFADSQQSFAIKLDKVPELKLTSGIRLFRYYLQTFKNRTHKHLRHHSFSWSIFPSLRKCKGLSRSIGAPSSYGASFLAFNFIKKKSYWCLRNSYKTVTKHNTCIS